MDKIRQIKSIALIIKTSGLEFDDRIRKVSIALSKKSDVKIFALLNDNTEYEGITSYGIPYHSISLKTRNIFSSARFLFIKTLEFNLRAIKLSKKYDIVWINDPETFLIPLLTHNRKIIWDLHELPEMFEKSIFKLIFHKIEKKVHKIIHANPFRIEYLKSKGLVLDNKKHDYIRNFPDSSFLNSSVVPEKYEKFKEWLGLNSFVYLQSLGSSLRFPYNSIASVLETSKHKIVVVGDINKKELSKLQNKYGKIIEDRIFFAGWTDQLAIPAYLKQASYTIVLYTKDTPNNLYCEANRFYQAIALGVPVICGFNEPMKEIVDKYDVGITLESDGRDIEQLKASIYTIESKNSLYKSNCIISKEKMIWNNDMVKEEWYNF